MGGRGISSRPREVAMRTLFSLLMCMLVLTAHTHAQGWVPQNTGVTITLYEVHFRGSNLGTAVGAGGKIVQTPNGGQSWFQTSSGTNIDLHGVDFANNSIGIIVGNGGLMLRSVNAGASWTNLVQLTGDNLRGISFADSQNGTIVGLNGAVFRTTNGGSTWAVQRGITSDLFEVAFITPEIGTVVGEGGLVLRTTNAGSTWVVQPSGTTHTMYGVSFPDVNNGVAVGSSGTIIRTTNGGQSWSSQFIGSGELTSVQMVTPSVGYITGQSGLVLKTTNGGASWIAQPSNTSNDLKEIFFSDPMTGTAVGVGGAAIRTVSGGAASVTAQYPVATDWNLVSVPLTLPNYTRTVVYPTSSSDAYYFDNGYQTQSVLQNRIGYWLKFDATQSVSMTGQVRARDTVNVVAGWNLIGSITNSVPVSSLVTIPAGIIEPGTVYGFNGSYYNASAIEPGNAYWVKVTGPGKIILISP